MERRTLLRTLAYGSAATIAVPAMAALTEGSATASLETGPDATSYMNNMGVGMYSDMTTAEQLSTFTIVPHLVTCGVGTFGPGGQSGAFAMLMYSSQSRASGRFAFMLWAMSHSRARTTSALFRHL